MKKRLLSAFLLFAFYISGSYGQAVLFSEDFESAEIPLNWKEEFVKGAISWRYENGGYTTSPAIPNTRKPISAHGGSYNALFQFQSMNNEATKLVTKKITALEFAIKPELHFFHAQMDWSHGGNLYHDYLKVYYKSGINKPWTLLRSYTEATADWVERIIVLPENDLSGDYYLAFEGITNWGWGTCVDDISIVETGVLPKSLSEISVEQAEVGSVSSGTDNNPVLKIKVKVVGNSGTLPLNSMVVSSLNADDADIKAGGVKVYSTRDAEFNTDMQIGSGASFVSGKATLSDLNFDLPIGYSYLWMTYDIEPLATHRDTIDAKFLANSININGNTYLATENSPDGSRTILQTLVSDDFESELRWNLGGEFEHGTPMGLGGSQGNPDPADAYSGTKIIGTDLTGLGDYSGDYEMLINRDQDYAITAESFDFSYKNDLTIRYMRHLNIGVNDEAFIKVSPDDGATWHTAWSNSSMILDDTWKLHEIDITGLAARKSQVKVMFSLGATNDYWQLSGWNIDDFIITGKNVLKDVGISRIITPKNGCGYTNDEAITVEIKNYGQEASSNSIPLEYSLDGKTTIIRDTLKQTIGVGESVVYTFKKKANLSIPDIYSLYVSTNMAGDDDRANDAIITPLYIQPTYSASHEEKFESKGGLWIPHAESLPNWEWGVPGFGLIAPSPTKVWMTQLTAYYPDSDSSFIESGCYSNVNGERKILHLKYWVSAEEHMDGAALQYSLNNGATWATLDTVINGWSWYNDTIQTLKSRGWSKTSDGWVDASIILPKKLTNAATMKFRMAFCSDAANNSVGFAFDNFSIFKAPVDIGISRIADFADVCQEVNPDYLTVDIKNYGISTIRQNDTVIAAFDLNQTKIVTDTIRVPAAILPGQVLAHTFSKAIRDLPAGNYNITAYTLSEADPSFYNTSNDTLSLDFEVYAAPITSLLDTIQTRQPDTIVLKPYYNINYDYLWHDGSEEREYPVKHRGWHIVKVTDNGSAHLCSLKDSTYVELLFNDVGASDLISPATSCGLSNSEFVTVGVKNCGTDSILAGQKIAVSYELNGGAPVSDTLVLTKNLLAYQTVPFTISKVPIDMSAAGTFHFVIYTSYGGDTVTHNDTIERTVQIMGRPVVSLGPDRIIEALTYILDPGSGYESFLWDSGETTQTITISEAGNYGVTVYDINGCDSRADVDIWLKIRDISPAGFTNPVSSCTFNSNEPVVLRIANSGTDTIPKNTQVDISYVFAEGSRVTGQLQLSNPLLPGQSISHTFPGNVNLGSEGDYLMEATAVITGDIRTANDTAKITVYRYPKPYVDFGLPASVVIPDVSYALDAGESPYYSYLWQDNSTDHAYTAYTSGLIHVKATDTRTQCFDRDTVMVALIYNDVGVISSDMVTSGCTGTFPNVKVRIKNLGTSQIGPTRPIHVVCDVNGSRVAFDTLVRTTQFNAGAEMDLILSGTVLVTEGGLNDIAFYTLYEDDKRHSNDTLHVTFEALQGPVIDFGDHNGSINGVNFPYALDAGDGYKSYLWQDDSENQIYLVNEPGTYSVVVTAQNNCQSSKIVRINLQDPVEDPEEYKEEMIIYPNPSNGLFRVVLDNGIDEEFVIHVFNNQGQVVFIKSSSNLELNNDFIDVQHLPKGLYYLIIQTKKQLYKGKIIISYDN